ncbi:MAG TPA: hypothetical protein VGG71_11850 [Chitinophagaceae bacterium]
MNKHERTTSAFVKAWLDNPQLCSSNSYHLLLSADTTLLNICIYLQQ